MTPPGAEAGLPDNGKNGRDQVGGVGDSGGRELRIELHHLNHWFGEGEAAKQVLTDINMTVHAGEIVILTGPSGSGKTTLLTMLGGLRAAQSGSLKVLGEDYSMPTTPFSPDCDARQASSSRPTICCPT